MKVEIADGEFLIDAAVIAKLLGVEARDVPALMREGAITGRTERGEDADAGLHRLTFFFRNRRARVFVDSEGRIVRRTAIDFGERPTPARRESRAGGQ